MKTILFLLFLLGIILPAFAQMSTLDIAGMHQLIDQSKTEYTKQGDARNRQSTVTANEQANLTLLTKMKDMYRTLQNRYNTLGTAIQLADIGIHASPMITRIIDYQAQIIGLVENRPELAVLGYRTEVEFAEKAYSMLGYITGLTLTLGDIYQMRASDRKLLFDEVLMQLSEIQELSGRLLNLLTYSNVSNLLRTLNPFQDYIDRDKELVEKIIRNAKYLR